MACGLMLGSVVLRYQMSFLLHWEKPMALMAISTTYQENERFLFFSFFFLPPSPKDSFSNRCYILGLTVHEELRSSLYLHYFSHIIRQKTVNF